MAYRNVRPTSQQQDTASQWLVAGLAIAGTVGAAVWAQNRRRRNIMARPADSAPARAARHHRGDYAMVGRSVTIDHPRAELYQFWRDFSNLPSFMENVYAVTPLEGDVSRWSIRGPMGQTIELDTEVTADRENEEIAWRSVDGSDIEAHGKVLFRDAPADRGTEVEAVIAYKPPGGDAGRWIAKLFQREPQIQGRRELKRLKMLMETGEIATADYYRRPGEQSQRTYHTGRAEESGGADRTARDEPSEGTGRASGGDGSGEEHRSFRHNDPQEAWQESDEKPGATHQTSSDDTPGGRSS